ncbi:hypothetical protein Cpir12675_003058, partial [Ceratocystis pirilliformis]
MARLDSFIWVRIQLKAFTFLGMKYNSLAYGMSLPLSITISLWSWGFKLLAISAVVVGIPLVVVLNELTSLVAKHRFA